MRVLLSPRWLVGHVIVLVAAVVMVSLGSWQLSRLDEVRSINTAVAERFDRAPVPFSEIAGTDPATAGELEFRQVTVTGTYLPDEEVLHRNRDHQGQGGFHVITPLVTAAGPTVLVRRGWVPYAMDTPPVTEAAPPGGEVTVTGWLEASTPQPSFGATDPAEGRLERVFNTDVERLDDQVTGEVFPMLVQLQDQTPGQPGDLPIATDPPDLDEGNHLSYALQWFSFAAIAVIGYAFFLRRRLQDRASDEERVEAPTR
jgi:surfeit locus 1 family protein